MAKRKAKTGNKTKPSSSTPAYLTSLVSFSHRKSVLCISLLLVALAVVAYYPNHGGDYDIWWHLKYGEHYVTNTTWNIDHTAYSWTPADGEWKYVTWIGSSILYLLYKAAALAGLSILQLVIIASIALLFLYYVKLRKEGISLNHIAGFLLVAVAINPTAIFIKPELFSILFFSCAVFIYFYAKSFSRSVFYLYPLLFLVWINTHGGFIIGLFFVTLALLLETGNYYFNPKNSLPAKVLRSFAICTAISYVVLVINPHGISYPLETISKLVIGEKSQFEILTAYINRWQYLFPSAYVFRRTNTAWAFMIMALVILTSFVYAYRKKKFFDIALPVIGAAFFVFGMNMARASIYFPIIWLFSIPYMIKKSDAFRLTYKTIPLALFLIVFGSGLCFYNTIAINTYKSWFGSKADDLVPVKEVEFIKDHNLPGPLFNDYLTGGYVIWSLYPDYGVFLDPRHRPYEKTGVWDDYVSFRQNPTIPMLESFASKYPFNTALINHLKYFEQAAAFLKSPQWQLVYFDKLAVVFVRRTSLEKFHTEQFSEILNPERFRDVNNPMILYSLFGVYFSMGSEYSEDILKFYETNVSDLYIIKKEHIRTMKHFLSLMQSGGKSG